MTQDICLQAWIERADGQSATKEDMDKVADMFTDWCEANGYHTSIFYSLRPRSEFDDFASVEVEP